MSIIIPKHLQRELEHQAIATYPNECCGFFFGIERRGNRYLQEVRPVQNAKEGDQRRRFEIDPLDYLKTEKYALENNLQLLGIYHSHPDHPAQPSTHDLKRAISFFSYIIMSVSNGSVNEMTSWQLFNDKFEEERIIIKKSVESIN